MADRNKRFRCICSGYFLRVPELFKLTTFEPHFDEGLGTDVHSERDRLDQMKMLGLEESNDKVGGARNFDSKAPDHIKKLPLKGIRKKPAPEYDNQVVEVLDDKGKTIDRTTFGELPSGFEEMSWGED
jgi:hypothetical protein